MKRVLALTAATAGAVALLVAPSASAAGEVCVDVAVQVQDQVVAPGEQCVATP